MDVITSLISSLPFEWAEFRFMQHALIGIIILGPLLASLGCMVINNQMAFFSDAIGHAGLTGIAIGALLGLSNPFWAMILFAIFLAVAITFFSSFKKTSVDTIIGIVMSCTVAVGIVILSRSGGFSRYTSFLIGDILSVTRKDISILCCAALVFTMLWILFFNRFLLVSLNKSLCLSRKIPLFTTQCLFSVITALIVTVSIQWVGILVINALLILPAAAARNVSRSIFSYIWNAIWISMASGIIGLILSYYFSTATGATMVIVCTFFYGATFCISWLRRN